EAKMGILVTNNSNISATIATDSTNTLPHSANSGSLYLVNGILYSYLDNYWYPIVRQTRSMLHTQTIANTEWTVNHLFDSNNIWFSVYDSNNNSIEPDNIVSNPDGNSVTLH